MKKILVLGDSHSGVFKNSAWKKTALSFKLSFETVVVYGATLSGLSNPNSKTKTIHSFNNALSKKNDAVVTMLGEVDCGFVIWFYAERDNIDVYSAAHKAVENYQDFLIKISSNSKVFVISAPLPTIGDNEVHGDVAQQRSKIKSTQKERTELTRWFNRKIQEFCFANRIEYINLDLVSLGSDNFVSKKLKNKNIADHHYDKKGYIQLLERHLLPRLLEIFGDQSSSSSADLARLRNSNSAYQFCDSPFVLKEEYIDLIRDSAIELEKVNIVKAYHLMFLAHLLRPSGNFIKQKVEDFEIKKDKIDFNV